MKRSLVYSGFTLFIVALFGAALKPVGSLAQSSNNGQGFQISPVLVELNADPGKSYDLQIKLRNVTSDTLVSRSSVNDFGAKDEAGNPKIILEEDEDNQNGTFSLKNWVSKIPNYTLKSQEEKNIAVKISIPKDAEPGGHYGVIRFTGAAPELVGDDNAVALSASIGTLVLVRVSGDVKEGAAIEEFFASQNGQKASFFEQGPLSLVERIKKTGNVHVKPTGTEVVKDMFGKTTASLKVNEPPKNVLPDSIRRFEQELNKKWLFGRYTADLNLAYGTTGQVLTGQLVFWVIPWKLIGAVILLLVALYLVLRTGLRRYNARVIAKAQSSTKSAKRKSSGKSKKR